MFPFFFLLFFKDTCLVWVSITFNFPFGPLGYVNSKKLKSECFWKGRKKAALSVFQEEASFTKAAMDKVQSSYLRSLQEVGDLLKKRAETIKNLKIWKKKKRKKPGHTPDWRWLYAPHAITYQPTSSALRVEQKTWPRCPVPIHPHYFLSGALYFSSSLPSGPPATLIAHKACK